MRLLSVLLCGLCLVGCGALADWAENQKRLKAKEAEDTTLQDLSTSTTTMQTKEFRLTDGTPCVVLYGGAYNYLALSCGWGLAKHTP